MLVNSYSVHIRVVELVEERFDALADELIELGKVESAAGQGERFGVEDWRGRDRWMTEGQSSKGQQACKMYQVFEVGLETIEHSLLDFAPSWIAWCPSSVPVTFRAIVGSNCSP